MTVKALPEDRFLLELMLKEATEYLRQIKPTLAKCQTKQRELEASLGDPELLAQRRPFIEELNRQIRQDVVSSLGLSVGLVLPYIERDRAGWRHLCHELDRCMSPSASFTPESRFRHFGQMYTTLEGFVEPIEELRTRLCARLENYRQPPALVKRVAAGPVSVFPVICVDLKAQTVLYKGVQHKVSKQVAMFIKMVVEADGRPVSGTEIALALGLKKLQTDRVKQAIPKEMKPLFESKSGRGSSFKKDMAT